MKFDYAIKRLNDALFTEAMFYRIAPTDREKESHKINITELEAAIKVLEREAGK